MLSFDWIFAVKLNFNLKHKLLEFAVCSVAENETARRCSANTDTLLRRTNVLNDLKFR